MSEDEELFRAEMQGVRRLRHDRVELRPQPPPPIPRQQEADIEQVKAEMLSDAFDARDLQTGDELDYARPGLDRNTLRRLRGGKFSIQGELDLHGLRVDEARGTVARFLAEASARDLRCVRIIHGKGFRSPEGTSVIKRKLDTWLRHNGRVLAYCPARPADGGSGAVYILLSRP
jgi:DNA-nicking Smr family endonuclease